MAEIKLLTMNIKEVLPCPPHGPLDVFRKRGSFNWRVMKIILETEEIIRYKCYLWELLRNDTLFDNSNHSLTLDETRNLTVKRLFALRNKNLFPTDDIAKHYLKIEALTDVLNTIDRSLASKSIIVTGMFPSTIMTLGTEEQFSKYVQPVLNGESTGCFALTEVAHGSNIKAMQTTATFQPDTKDFVLHSPGFEAAKCWIGNLGKTATVALVYAQLVSKGRQYGLHSFVVPIRCPYTLKPYSGITIGDLGEKIGLNGIDNGFIMFDNYRLPFDSQLARHGGVNAEGDYVVKTKDIDRKFASLGVVSAGRVGIVGVANMYLQMGVVIATRYAAIRKQFKDTSNATEETPIIEYQSVQTRLMPYLASTFVVKVFSSWFSKQNAKMGKRIIDNPKFTLAELGIEIHALSSAAKPLCSWLARDGLQMCRELCAGHGYLKSAGIGDIRNDNDANCTYEGENSVLIQQTINWLVSIWSKRSYPEIFDTPLNTVYFLKDSERILQQKVNLKSIEEAVNIQSTLNAYKWLVTYMLKSTAQKIESLKKKTNDSLKARNDAQSYYGLPTAIAFVEHCILDRALMIITEIQPSNEKKVLLDLLSLFGAWLLEKHMGTLYMGGYWSESNSGQFLRESIIGLCKKVSTEAVLLADVIAPPDFILNSVLGASDGQMYKNLQNAVFTAPGAISRPDWWQDVVNWKSYVPAKI